MVRSSTDTFQLTRQTQQSSPTLGSMLMCVSQLLYLDFLIKNLDGNQNISVFSGVQVLWDQNNLTESRSRHDGDVQVMKHSIFHHCQTSNIWSRDRECLIKAYILQLSDIRSCYMQGKKAKYFQNMTNCAQTSILIVHSYANLQIFCHNKCTVAKREMQDKEFQHLSTLAIFSTTVRAWCLAQSLVQLLCTKLFWVCKSVVVWRKV